MCKALSPSVFLALAFSQSNKDLMKYEELERMRKVITQLKSSDHETYEVDWRHDSVQFAMGFYSPVFHEEPDGVSCNQDELKRYYPQLLSHLADTGEKEKLERAFA